MKRIMISADQINSSSDIESFVGQHTNLMQQPQVPPFEQHPMSTRVLDRVGMEWNPGWGR